jgi:predicted DNA-binding transcriptional regulator AlpA
MKSEKVWREQIETPRWIDEKEVSQIMGIAVQTLRNWRFKRVGPPYVKVSKAVRYRVDEVIDFMERKKINVEGR